MVEIGNAVRIIKVPVTDWCFAKTGTVIGFATGTMYPETRLVIVGLDQVAPDGSSAIVITNHCLRVLE